MLRWKTILSFCLAMAIGSLLTLGVMEVGKPRAHNGFPHGAELQGLLVALSATYSSDAAQAETADAGSSTPWPAMARSSSNTTKAVAARNCGGGEPVRARPLRGPRAIGQEADRA